MTKENLPTEHEAIAKRQLEVDAMVGRLLQLPCLLKAKEDYTRLKIVMPLAAVYAGVQPLLKELLDPSHRPTPERERQLKALLWDVLP